MTGLEKMDGKDLRKPITFSVTVFFGNDGDGAGVQSGEVAMFRLNEVVATPKVLVLQ